MKTYRFKMSPELQEEMSIFSRKYRHMDRISFNDLFDDWYQEQIVLINKETTALHSNGYTNDIRDKIYKSIRYYHLKKAISKESKGIYENELEEEEEPEKTEEKEEKERTTFNKKKCTTNKKRCFLPNEVIKKISEYISRKDMLNEKPSYMFESFTKEYDTYLNCLLKTINEETNKNKTETETKTEKKDCVITKSILHSKLKKSFKNKCFKLRKISTSSTSNSTSTST